MSIRDARPHERQALAELHRRASYVWPQDRVHLDAHPEVFGVAAEAIAQGRVRVAVGEGDAILGFSVVAGALDGPCVLDDLFVDPDLMRRGIGQALVTDAARRALLAGYAEMTVVAHPRNFPFYESVDFVTGEVVATQFGPAVRMRRTLMAGLR